jgi:hypothetical protein
MIPGPPNPRSPRHPLPRLRRHSVLLVTLLPFARLLLGAAPVAAEEREVQATLNQVRDAWLAADAVVVGIYAGVDSTFGPLYHVIDVREVWMGTFPGGKLVFKAPRGVYEPKGTEVLLMLWDRLNGATDSYLETARKRYGEESALTIGPDSITNYLLPFAAYAFPFHKGKMLLRGKTSLQEEIKRSDLHRELLDLEHSLLPAELYRRADAVVYARVSAIDRRSMVIEETTLEYHIVVDFEVIDVFKGKTISTLHLDYRSFPRSPRFKENEEVILFLARSGDDLFLESGKRSVFHVVQGVVAENDQPLAEFEHSLHASKH